jgi:hypothetical protein
MSALPAKADMVQHERDVRLMRRSAVYLANASTHEVFATEK